MSIFGDIWNGIKGVGHTLGGIAEHVAPVLGLIPGVGTLAAGAIGGIGAGLHGDNILGGALGGASGGLAKGLLGKLTGGGAAAAAGDGTDAAGAATGSGGSSGGLLGSIGGALGLTPSQLLSGVATGLGAAQDQSNTNFDQGIKTGQLALAGKTEADQNANTQTGLKTTAATDAGNLGISSGSADTTRKTAAGNLGLGQEAADTSRASTLGSLGIGQQNADTSRSSAAASGGTSLIGALTNKANVEGNQTLTGSQQQIGQRQFDTTTGITQADTQYDRAKAQALAAARARYVGGLATGQTFAQQAQQGVT